MFGHSLAAPRMLAGASAPPDIPTWTLAEVPSAAQQISSVAWSPTRGIFVMVTGAQTGTDAYTSTDGLNWTPRTTSTLAPWVAVCWSPEKGLFVAVSSDSSGNVMTSPDGVTWTARTAPNLPFSAVCWSPEKGLFVAVSQSLSSTDATTSPDGVTWTARTTPQGSGDPVNWNAVVWAPGIGLFVAVGSTSGYDQVSQCVMTSPDGVTWTIRDIGFNVEGPFAVAWAPSLGVLAATGPSNATMTSPDGVTWTATRGTSNTPTCLCWSADRSLFMCFGRGQTGHDAETSPDGVTWTAQTTPSNSTGTPSYAGCCWASGPALFVGVGSNASDVATATYHP